MKTASCYLVSAAPYSPSRAYKHEVPMENRETHEAYEERTWRNKAHTNSDGYVLLPPMGFKQCLDTAAKRLSIQIPGKGKATYTKHFESGVLVMEPLVLPIKKDDTILERIHANADGVRGSGKRVWRNFPRIDHWEGEVSYHVLADEITRDIFEQVLRQSGAFVGVGRFRPERGGFYGRFSVKSVKWS